MMTSTQVKDIPPIRRSEARLLAETEFQRFAQMLMALEPRDWAQPTDCDRWDVRGVALHVLGSAEAQASPRELVHQFRRGLPLNKQIDARHWVDGLNELQVRERADVSNEEIAQRMKEIGPKAVRGRWRTPPPVRWLPVPFGPPVGVKPLRYLLDVGFTRDVWMHRVDIAVATGRELVLTADHDGRLVADIVAEWAALHGKPFTLEIGGPAGGTFAQGSGGEHVRIDAIEFCRVLAGRAPGDGVLAHPLPL
jgi:uncharacterized protein (TIGR03083 family)